MDDGVDMSNPADAFSNPDCATTARGAEKMPALPLPARLFPTGAHNPGYVPPRFLLDAAQLANIEPPSVVKKFAQRLDELTESERAAYESFRKDVVVASGWDTSRDIDEWETLRFLVARSFDVPKATKMLASHVEWVEANKPAQMVCHTCNRDPANHMMQFTGWDRQHRPVIYMSYKYSADRVDPQNSIEHNVSTFNLLKTLMPEGVEQWVAITDFVSYSHWRDGTSSVGRTIIQVLQDHYPERLGLQILVDPPTMFWVFFKMLQPFIDEKTKKKVVFVYTDKQPNIRDEFPKLFPPHLSDYLIEAYINNKVSYAEEQKAKK
jgi:hypothetical protein